jgi:glycosyltransferase involved in cell wall biosynthesis
MRTKIIYLVTKSNWGGAQRYVYDLATHLPPERFDVAVAAGSPSGEGVSGDGLLFARMAAAGIRTIPLDGLRRDVGPLRDIAACAELVRLFVRERPDIAHLNSSKAGALGAVATAIASLICRKKIRTVFTAHGWGFYEDRARGARAAVFLASVVSSLFQDAIITISAADRRAAESFVPRRKIRTIFNGIGGEDLMPREPARALLSSLCGAPVADDQVLIGTVAELTANKNIPCLIRAYTLIVSRWQSGRGPTPHLMIIGDGEQRHALETQIKDLGMWKHITLAGFHPGAAAALSGLDIFVLPSLKEGVPYAVLEAMSAGLPVVATRVGGLPDMITSGKDGILVPPRDERALAEGIRLLMRDTALRRRIGDAAREKTATKFAFRAMLSSTVAVYDSL